MRSIYHRRAERVRAHIFIAALGLLFERIIEKRLKENGSSLSVRDAIDALATVSVVEFDIQGRKQKGTTAGNNRAREVLNIFGIKKIHLPHIQS